MPVARFPERGLKLRDASLLAVARLDAALDGVSNWSRADEEHLRSAAGWLRGGHADAVAIIAKDAERIVSGIALVPFLEPDGPFGPSWVAHPFGSRAIAAGYKLREPDITRSLKSLMERAAGRWGATRAVTFLRLLTEMIGADALRNSITARTCPTVLAEHPVFPRIARSLDDATGPRAAPTRIDLLFEWPIQGEQNAVLVIEAKLGAAVSDGQLRSYRAEALRRARGGPVACVLLTAWADAAEMHYRQWAPVRWFGLLRRWEALIAQDGDDDAEFARVRAHLWNFVLGHRKAYQ